MTPKLTFIRAHNALLSPCDPPFLRTVSHPLVPFPFRSRLAHSRAPKLSRTRAHKALLSLTFTKDTFFSSTEIFAIGQHTTVTLWIHLHACSMSANLSHDDDAQSEVFAPHDRDGHLSGIVAQAFRDHLSELRDGRHDYDVRLISQRRGLGLLDSHSQLMAITPGHVLPQSLHVLAALLRITPNAREQFADFGCECGTAITYLAHYHRCRGVGFEIVPSRADIARRVAKAVRLRRRSRALVTIIEGDFMTPPVTADIQRTTVALICDLKFDPSTTSDLLDMLVTNCPNLSHLVKIMPLSSAHAVHFMPPESVSLHCSWSPNPVVFLLYRRVVSPHSFE